MKALTRSLCLLSSLLLAAPAAAEDKPVLNTSRRIFGTRAIVACEPATRDCGIGVISFPAGVPMMVPYGKPGAMVAAMFIPSADNGSAVLSRISSGEDPQQVVDEVLAADDWRDLRQMAAIVIGEDGTVRVGQRSGAWTSEHTCAIKGGTYVVQANNQTSPDVCRAMAEGFEHASGSLAMRLLASLKAGARVGVDRSGELSGTIRVYSGRPEQTPYTHVIADTSVNGNPEALAYMERELYRYLGQVAPPRSADLVPLDAATARAVQGVLKERGYYSGPLDGVWTDSLEEALMLFQNNNNYFFKPTVVVDGARKIDGPFVNWIARAAPASLYPATP